LYPFKRGEARATFCAGAAAANGRAIFCRAAILHLRIVKSAEGALHAG
jgi:hypothetical protein